MKSLKANVIAHTDITSIVKDTLAEKIKNENLKEKVLEYIEAKKLVSQIAREIVEIHEESLDTSEYLNDLENDIKIAQKKAKKEKK